MNAKELVTEYYQTDNFKSAEKAKRFLHDELQLKWHSTKGFLQIDKHDLLVLIAELEKSYVEARLNVSHILAEDNCVTVRYTHYVNAIENPAEEVVLAHFVVIWEIKDGQFYKGFLMSQLD